MGNCSTKTAMVISAHPDTSGFTHALARTCLETLRTAGWNSLYHDLYAEGFDPVMPPADLRRGSSLDPSVVKHAADLEQSAFLFVFHPDWWGQPPAVLKGWIDRVLTPGSAFSYEGEEFGEKKLVPLMGGKGAFVCVTSDGNEPHSLEEIWKNRVLGLCGFSPVSFLFLPGLRGSSHSTRMAWLENAGRSVLRLIAPD